MTGQGRGGDKRRESQRHGRLQDRDGGPRVRDDRGPNSGKAAIQPVAGRATWPSHAGPAPDGSAPSTGYGGQAAHGPFHQPYPSQRDIPGRGAGPAGPANQAAGLAAQGPPHTAVQVPPSGSSGYPEHSQATWGTDPRATAGPMSAPRHQGGGSGSGAPYVMDSLLPTQGPPQDAFSNPQHHDQAPPPYVTSQGPPVQGPQTGPPQSHHQQHPPHGRMDGHLRMDAHLRKNEGTAIQPPPQQAGPHTQVQEAFPQQYDGRRNSNGTDGPTPREMGRAAPAPLQRQQQEPMQHPHLHPHHHHSHHLVEQHPHHPQYPPPQSGAVASWHPEQRGPPHGAASAQQLDPTFVRQPGGAPSTGNASGGQPAAAAAPGPDGTSSPETQAAKPRRSRWRDSDATIASKATGAGAVGRVLGSGSGDPAAGPKGAEQGRAIVGGGEPYGGGNGLTDARGPGPQGDGIGRAVPPDAATGAAGAPPPPPGWVPQHQQHQQGAHHYVGEPRPMYDSGPRPALSQHDWPPPYGPAAQGSAGEGPGGAPPPPPQWAAAPAPGGPSGQDPWVGAQGMQPALQQNQQSILHHGPHPHPHSYPVLQQAAKPAQAAAYGFGGTIPLQAPGRLDGQQSEGVRSSVPHDHPANQPPEYDPFSQPWSYTGSHGAGSGPAGAGRPTEARAVAGGGAPSTLPPSAEPAAAGQPTPYGNGGYHGGPYTVPSGQRSMHGYAPQQQHQAPGQQPPGYAPELIGLHQAGPGAELGPLPHSRPQKRKSRWDIDSGNSGGEAEPGAGAPAGAAQHPHGGPPHQGGPPQQHGYAAPPHGPPGYQIYPPQEQHPPQQQQQQPPYAPLAEGLPPPHYHTFQQPAPAEQRQSGGGEGASATPPYGAAQQYLPPYGDLHAGAPGRPALEPTDGIREGPAGPHDERRSKRTRWDSHPTAAHATASLPQQQQQGQQPPPSQHQQPPQQGPPWQYGGEGEPSPHGPGEEVRAAGQQPRLGAPAQCDQPPQPQYDMPTQPYQYGPGQPPHALKGPVQQQEPQLHHHQYHHHHHQPSHMQGPAREGSGGGVADGSGQPSGSWEPSLEGPGGGAPGRSGVVAGGQTAPASGPQPPKQQGPLQGAVHSEGYYRPGFTAPQQQQHQLPQVQRPAGGGGPGAAEPWMGGAHPSAAGGPQWRGQETWQQQQHQQQQGVANGPDAQGWSALQPQQHPSQLHGQPQQQQPSGYQQLPGHQQHHPQLSPPHQPQSQLQPSPPHAGVPAQQPHGQQQPMPPPSQTPAHQAQQGPVPGPGPYTQQPEQGPWGGRQAVGAGTAGMAQPAYPQQAQPQTQLQLPGSGQDSQGHGQQQGQRPLSYGQQAAPPYTAQVGQQQQGPLQAAQRHETGLRSPQHHGGGLQQQGSVGPALAAPPLQQGGPPQLVSQPWQDRAAGGATGGAAGAGAGAPAPQQPQAQQYPQHATPQDPQQQRQQQQQTQYPVSTGAQTANSGQQLMQQQQSAAAVPQQQQQQQQQQAQSQLPENVGGFLQPDLLSSTLAALQQHFSQKQQQQQQQQGAVQLAGGMPVPTALPMGASSGASTQAASYPWPDVNAPAQQQQQQQQQHGVIAQRPAATTAYPQQVPGAGATYPYGNPQQQQPQQGSQAPGASVSAPTAASAASQPSVANPTAGAIGAAKGPTGAAAAGGVGGAQPLLTLGTITLPPNVDPSRLTSTDLLALLMQQHGGDRGQLAEVLSALNKQGAGAAAGSGKQQVVQGGGGGGGLEPVGAKLAPPAPAPAQAEDTAAVAAAAAAAAAAGALGSVAALAAGGAQPASAANPNAAGGAAGVTSVSGYGPWSAGYGQAPGAAAFAGEGGKQQQQQQQLQYQYQFQYAYPYQQLAQQTQQPQGQPPQQPQQPQQPQPQPQHQQLAGGQQATATAQPLPVAAGGAQPADSAPITAYHHYYQSYYQQYPQGFYSYAYAAPGQQAAAPAGAGASAASGAAGSPPAPIDPRLRR